MLLLTAPGQHIHCWREIKQTCAPGSHLHLFAAPSARARRRAVRGRCGWPSWRWRRRCWRRRWRGSRRRLRRRRKLLRLLVLLRRKLLLLLTPGTTQSAQSECQKLPVLPCKFALGCRKRKQKHRAGQSLGSMMERLLPHPVVAGLDKVRGPVSLPGMPWVQAQGSPAPPSSSQQVRSACSSAPAPQCRCHGPFCTANTLAGWLITVRQPVLRANPVLTEQ